MQSPSIKDANLPDDFARRVIAQARREQHQRRMRFRVAAAACATLIFALIPLTRAFYSGRHNLGPPDSSTIGRRDNSRENFRDSLEAASAQLTATTSPDDVSDYLMPNATRIGNFVDDYSDASWQYDPDWSGRS